jgi:hypothetical protein
MGDFFEKVMQKLFFLDPEIDWSQIWTRKNTRKISIGRTNWNGTGT